MKYLVTGGCGFIGSNFIHRCFECTKNIKIINIDAMLIGSNPMSLQNLKNHNYRFVKGNICNRKLIDKLVSQVDCVINFAAESHVDRSIASSWPFIKSNMIGVYTLLEAIRHHKVKLLHISTDEVYGEVLKGSRHEHDELNPSNPYSATKASAEMIIRAYARTYDLDTIITRSVNNFGPRQFPEKLIPKTILSALKNKPVPLHGDGSYKRQWIHVFDHCDALLKILSKWKRSSIYNISTSFEITNLQLVKRILKIMNKSEELIVSVKDRPGQDRRYSINSNLIKRELGFRPKIEFYKGLKSTIDWYITNRKWWESLKFSKIKNPTPWFN